MHEEETISGITPQILRNLSVCSPKISTHSSIYPPQYLLTVSSPSQNAYPETNALLEMPARNESLPRMSASSRETEQGCQSAEAHSRITEEDSLGGSE